MKNKGSKPNNRIINFVDPVLIARYFPGLKRAPTRKVAGILLKDRKRPDR